ncbi:MAG TPA: serine hydrolase domain-containing protein [Stellaceae bacterium]
MKMLNYAAPALFAVFVASAAHAQEPAAAAHPEQLGFAPDRLAKITETYKGFVDRNELPGAVLLIARGDKIAYFDAVGFEDRDKKTPMRKDSIFRLASMTKPIVGVALMTLVEEGKVDLMAPVSKYLPEFKGLKVGVEAVEPGTGKPALTLEPQHREMTVQDLMRHTAGLVYGNNGDGLIYKMYQDANVTDRNQTLTEMVTKLSKIPLAHQPGTEWEYSMAVDVQGRIIEVASGMPLDQFIQQRVAKPLGMSATDFFVHEGDVDRLAQAQPEGDHRMPPDVTKKPNFFSGGGGLVASASDYLKFTEMLLHEGAYSGGRILAPHTVKLMTSNALPPDVKYADLATRFADIAPTPTMGQGFGLDFCVRVAEGHNPLPGSVGNFYWTGAWGTTFWVDPKEQLIAIMMIQTPAGVGSPFRQVFRAMTYAALTEGEAGR